VWTSSYAWGQIASMENGHGENRLLEESSTSFVEGFASTYVSNMCAIWLQRDLSRIRGYDRVEMELFILEGS